MKRLLFALTLSAAVAIPALAQPTDSTSAPSNTPPSGPPPDGGGHGGMHGMKFLTDAERAELKKAHDEAITADPALGTEEKANMEAMKAAHDSGTPPTEEQKAQFHAFRDKLDAAMIKADPAVEPIIEKIKAHHHGPGGDKGGTPPAPPAQ